MEFLKKNLMGDKGRDTGLFVSSKTFAVESNFLSPLSMKLLWEMEEPAKWMLLNQWELYQCLRNPWKTLFLSLAALIQGDLCHICFKTLTFSIELSRERKHVNLGCRMKLSSPFPETSRVHLKLEFLSASQYQVRIIYWFWH